MTKLNPPKKLTRAKSFPIKKRSAATLSMLSVPAVAAIQAMPWHYDPSIIASDLPLWLRKAPKNRPSRSARSAAAKTPRKIR